MPTNSIPHTVPLASVLGAVMADLARARVMADQESLRIARAYAEDPLLATLSIPRIRLPEVVLDLPVLLQEVLEGHAPTASQPENVAVAIRNAVESQLAEPPPLPSPLFVSNLASDLQSRLAIVAQSAPKDSAYPDVIADEAAARVVAALGRSDWAPPALSDARREALLTEVRRVARANAWQDAGATSATGVIVDTTVVREQGSQLNITRLQITLKEDGLEWKQIERSDGSRTRKLQPE